MLNRLGILEAILFSSPEPINRARIAEVMQLDERSLDELLIDFTQSLQSLDRGVLLRAVAEGLQLVTKAEAHETVRQLNAPRQYRLSKPTLEVLAIIAYKQPVTRAEIEELRGVKCERALLTLLDKGLVKEVGRKDTVGRPILYGTTDAFLGHFNLTCLAELPKAGKMEL